MKCPTCGNEYDKGFIANPFLIGNFKYTTGGVKLLQNKPNRMSLIATYTIPFMQRLLFDPDDKNQKILFMAFDKNIYELDNFIVGDIEIILTDASHSDMIPLYKSNNAHLLQDEYFEKLHHIDDVYKLFQHNIKSSPLQKWQHKNLGAQGQMVEVYFKSEKVFDPMNSMLIIEVKEGIR